MSDGNFIDRWDFSKDTVPSAAYEDFRSRYGMPIPATKVPGNVTYIQLMEIIGNLWEQMNPQVEFAPLGNREKYTSERGYIIYSLENKKPSENNLKPKFREDLVQTDTAEFLGSVYTQSFDHLIEFMAVHKDPKTADKILEAFEDFMMVILPELKYIGVEKIFYNRRISDRDQSRVGDDVSSKSVIYFATLQKLLIVKPKILESIRLDIRILREQATPESNEVMFMDIPYVS